jgi:hypothetical protein
MIIKTLFMNTPNNEMDRNRSSDTGRGNDPNLRDDSALQPGISTVSDSQSDDLNDDLTQTAAGDDFTDDLEDDDADATFEEVDEEDEEDEM